MHNSNVPTRVLAEPLERARLWVPWPVLLESDPLPAIEEPPDENKPTVPDGFDPDATEPPEEDEVELSAADRYTDACAICHSDSCAC